MSSKTLDISPETLKPPKSSHKTRNVWIGIGVSAIIIVAIILGLTLSKNKTPTSPVCYLSNLMNYMSLAVIVPSGIMTKDSYVYITLTSIATSGTQTIKLLASHGVQMTDYFASVILDIDPTSPFTVKYDVDTNFFTGGTDSEFTCEPQNDVLMFLDVNPSAKSAYSLRDPTGPVCFLSSIIDSNAYAICLPSGSSVSNSSTKAFLVRINVKETGNIFVPNTLTLKRDASGVLQATLPDSQIIVSYDPKKTEFNITDNITADIIKCQLQDDVLEFLKLYSYHSTEYMVNITGTEKTFHRIQPICDDWKKILSTFTAASRNLKI